MIYSNYELIEMMNCETCFYADQEKLKEAKKFHDLKMWGKCSDIKGACTFPHKRNLEFPKKEVVICHNHKEK